MDNKHTPGPWMVRENGGKGELVGIYANDSSWFIAEEILLKNAELIAKAPELLEENTRLKADNKCLTDLVKIREKQGARAGEGCETLRSAFIAGQNNYLSDVNDFYPKENEQ
jgi:hypothetical protein